MEQNIPVFSLRNTNSLPEIWEQSSDMVHTNPHKNQLPPICLQLLLMLLSFHSKIQKRESTFYPTLS